VCSLAEKTLEGTLNADGYTFTTIRVIKNGQNFEFHILGRQNELESEKPSLLQKITKKEEKTERKQPVLNVQDQTECLSVSLGEVKYELSLYYLRFDELSNEYLIGVQALCTGLSNPGELDSTLLKKLEDEVLKFASSFVLRLEKR
jgi:hypothetical protein